MFDEQKPTILVVDDEQSCRDLYQEALLVHGYEVLLASTKEEAIQIIASRKVDGVVCDIQLPGNGVHVYEFLLKNHPDLHGRFIFVTGSVEKKEQVERTHHSTPCLLKPFPLRMLLDAMRTALAG